MLSTEHPSTPSCSLKTVSPPASDHQEKPADLVQHTPKFSIRDYVFASRSKGIKTSWPFRPQSLQLCLKRGVKDLLPPFEPPDLVRARSSCVSVGSEQCVAFLEADDHVADHRVKDGDSSNASTSGIKYQSCSLDDEPLVRLLDQSRHASPEDGKSNTEKGGKIDELVRADEATTSVLLDNSGKEPSAEVEAAVPSPPPRDLDILRGPTEKKCRLVVKLGSLTDTRRAEDVSSTSSTASDPMASKTCPVCKVFASTSNTTLNAHIDQCLSVESNTEQAETISLKPKFKPRKKRLMVDIYKTALPYTLEDLDRRNGTNWATELALAAMNKEVCTENRSPEEVPFDPRDDEREGDVYVDSNGIKIRILSKSNDMPLVSDDELGLRKIAKHEARKSILISKKFFKSKDLTNKKLKIHGKKYSKLNVLNSQVRAYRDGGADDNIHREEEEPAVGMPKPTESTIHESSEPIRQWACSKRSDLAKKLSRKATGKTFKILEPETRKFGRSSMLDSGGPRVPVTPSRSFSRSTEEMATTSETNVDDQRNGSPRLISPAPRWSSKVSSSNSPMLKMPRPAATIAKRKIMEIGRGEAYVSDSSNMMMSSSLGKGFRGRSLSISLARPRDDRDQDPTSSKKFRKHRSLLRTGRRDFAPSDAAVAHRFSDDQEPHIKHANKKLRLNNIGTSRSVMRPALEETTDNDCSSESDVPVSGRGDDQCETAERDESPPMECEGDQAETDMQVDISASGSHPRSCSNDVSNGSLHLENSKTVHDAVLAEGQREAMDVRSSDEQLMHHARVSDTERRADRASTKESSACLTNNGDMGLEAPQDNSSITSNREDSNHDHGLAYDKDSSDSPLSTASTMSLPNVKDLKSKELEPGPSNAGITSIEEGNTRSTNEQTNLALPAREHEQSSNDKPFCCSCRESLSREPQVHQHSATARAMPMFKAKQIPQLHIGLRESSSFTSYQRTNNTKANPGLELHGQSFSADASADSAMNAPSYTANCSSPSLQTQLPSPSNPILRLMGKNLMVMNSEEGGHPQAPNPDYFLRGNYMTPLGFAPPNAQYQHLGSPAFINRAPSMAPSMASHQIPLSASGYIGPALHNAAIVQSDRHSQQTPYRNIVPMMRPAYMMKEVIMIDDSPEHRNEPNVSVLLPPAASATAISVSNPLAQQPFFCLPPPSPILPRHGAVGSTPMFTSINPMVSIGSTSQATTSEVTNPFMSNPFFVQSPAGYLSPSVYYSRNLQ